jgi:DNA invertase Pin-like site-specific DNA recombinase
MDGGLKRATYVENTNIGYARVSTNGQEKNGYGIDVQITRLTEAGCKCIYRDTASGGKRERTELTKMLDKLHPGDVVTVVKLDRLARSLRDLLDIIERIAKAGAGFRSLTEAIDTTTPAGTMIMHVIGAMAEFERSLIRERTRAGLAEAHKAGRKLGRGFKLSDEDRRQIVYLVREGKMSAADCARTYHIHESNISRLLAATPKE